MTPAPWKLDETWMTIVGPKGEEVCAIHAGELPSRRVNRSTAHENATLIAQSPAMLEALRFVISKLDAGKSQGLLYSDALSPKDTDDETVLEYLKAVVGGAT